MSSQPMDVVGTEGNKRKIKRGTKPGHASEKTLGHNYGVVTLG